ncbi:hypothetical protein N0V95_004487 [Ascochyta clinopodiicola]|nr:hypothetical protein N0V95_004487 [Ascochyta clinopodiicola]
MAYENSPASASASASNQPQALTLVDIKRKLAQMHPGAHFRFPDSTGCTFEDKTSLKNKNLLDKSSCTAMLRLGSETKEVGNDPESELEDGRANSNKRQRLSSPSPLLTEARNMPEKVSKEKFTPFKVRKVSLQGSVNTASPEANPSAVMAGATSLMATPISEPSPVFAPGQDTQDDPIAAIERRNAENTQDITAMHSELLTLRHRLANHTNLTQLISKQTTEIKHLKRSESKYRKLSKDQEAQLTRVQADLRVERRLRIKAKKELSELLEGQASLVAKYKR